MEVKILRGVPGSGKSYYVKSHWPGAKCFSADSFFMNDCGVYCFDPTMLGKAHQECLRDYVDFLIEFSNRKLWPSYEYTNNAVVVDNTNITAAEIAPYYAVAEAYGFDVEIIQLSGNYQNLHGVSEPAILNMKLVMEREVLPPWWNVTKA